MTSRAALATGAVALLTLAHFFGVASSLGSPDAIRTWSVATAWTGSIIGVVGTAAAAAAFARGDHLRRIWILMAAAALLVLGDTALRAFWIHFAPGRDFLESPLLLPRAVISLLANASIVWAMVLMAGTYRKSGLKPESSITWNGAWLCLTALALYLATRQLGADAAKMTSLPQTFSSLANMASTVGDAATIILIVPLLRVAYLLRGGRLAWVWWAVGLCGATWLVLDMQSWIAGLLPGDPSHNVQFIRVFRTPALALLGLAGFLQRDALREPRASSDSAPAAAA